MADKNKTNGTMADGKAVNGRIAKHRSTLKRILDYIGVYKWLVLLSLVLAALTVAATLYVPILTGNAVDLILGPGQVDFAGLIGGADGSGPVADEPHQ